MTIPCPVRLDRMQKFAGLVNKQQIGLAEKLRIDDARKVLNSANLAVRDLGAALFRDPLNMGGRGGNAQGWTAEERKMLHYRRILGPVMREYREVRAEAIAVAGGSGVAALATGKRAALAQQWDRLVTEYTRSETKKTFQMPAEFANAKPQLLKAYQATRKFYSDAVDVLKDSGFEGAEELLASPTYMPRHWRIVAMRDAEKRLGRGALVSLVAQSLKGNLKGDTAYAEKFLGVLQRSEFSGTFQDVQLAGKDMGTLRSELAGQGLQAEDIDDIIDTLFERKEMPDSGKPARLKFRADFDESAEIKLGNGETLRFADLVENDAVFLMDSYARTMFGHASMAELGYKSQREVLRAIERAKEDYAANVTLDGDGKTRARNVGLLEDGYKVLIGAPISEHDFTATGRVLSSMRAYTRSTMLGMLGFTAIGELKNALANTSTKAMMAHMHGFREIVSAARRGYVVNDELFEDIAALTGFGYDMAIRHARGYELEEFSGMGEHLLNRFERFSQNASYSVDSLSGNAGFTSFTRYKAAAAFTQQLADHASGSIKMSADDMRRLVNYGIDEQDQQRFFTDLKRFTKIDKDTGRVQRIDYNTWSKAAPESLSDYTLALSRFGRDVIQENGLGTVPIAVSKSPVLRALTELRTFSLGAHTTQFLRNVTDADGGLSLDKRAAFVFAVNFMGEALMYVAQTSIRFAGMSEVLEEKLTEDKIALAAISRMGTLGVLPMLLDTTSAVVLDGQTWFSAGAANTESRVVWNTPSAVVAGRMVQGLGALFDTINPYGTVTSEEVRALLRSVPGSSIIGLSTLINNVSDLFPKSDPNPGLSEVLE